MDKIYELLAALQRAADVDQEDTEALKAALLEVAQKADFVVDLDVGGKDISTQATQARILVQAVSAIFLSAHQVSDKVGGGSFKDAVNVMVTPKTPKAKAKRTKKIPA